MNTFKLGDRVAVYDEIRRTGTVAIVEEGQLLVRYDDNFHIIDHNWLHVKQCRRLMSKKRKVRKMAKWRSIAQKRGKNE